MKVANIVFAITAGADVLQAVCSSVLGLVESTQLFSTVIDLARFVDAAALRGVSVAEGTAAAAKTVELG